MKIMLWIIDKIFFRRQRAIFLCLLFCFGSLLVECVFLVKGFFAASGTLFTLAGLFLSIKSTMHFHLRLPNGNKLGVHSKYAMMTGRGTFGGNESDSEKTEFVREVELDEVWAVVFIIAGTILWGYGQYFVLLIPSICYRFVH